MDIENLINCIAHDADGIYRYFYQQKVAKIISQQTRDSELPRMKIKRSLLLDTIKSRFPEAAIKELNEWKDLIKLDNVDFKIHNFCKKIRISIKGHEDFYFYGAADRVGEVFVDSVPNLIEYMKEIDSLMPEWEKEYANLISQHDSKISDALRVSLFSGECKLCDILKCRMELALAECRTDIGAGLKLRKILAESNASFEHIMVSTQNTPYRIKNFGRNYSKDDMITIAVLAIDNCAMNFYDTEITIEKLAHIDRMMPIWIEECKQWEYENEKQKKAQEIKSMSVSALIKQKMKQLGCEYYISTNQKTTSLYIRLEKSRMLKLSLPDLAISTISRRIEMIEDAVKAINNIHNAFRITNEGKNIDWKKGNDTK